MPSVHINFPREPSGPGVPLLLRSAARRLRNPSTRVWLYVRMRDCRITGSLVVPAALAVARSWSHDPPVRAAPPSSPVSDLSRSNPSVVRATFHPSPSPPSRNESGILTSLKKTSLNEDPPLICRIGRISIPGASIGTRNAVIPRCFRASGSERAINSPHSQNCAPELQTFWPLMTHSSPSCSALHPSPARSLPAPGSENS